MKKTIVILALAAGFYWWTQQPTTTTQAVKPIPTPTAPRQTQIVVVPASQGGLDGKGGWEFKSNITSDKQTDLTMQRSW